MCKAGTFTVYSILTKTYGNILVLYTVHLNFDLKQFWKTLNIPPNTKSEVQNATPLAQSKGVELLKKIAGIDI